MRTNEFIDEILTDACRQAIKAVATSEVENFAYLTKLAGLDPATAFRFVDLSGMDFSDCDLSGYDFTGADLRGCAGVGVTWSSKTIFDDARLDASIFAHSVRLAKFMANEPRWRRRVEILQSSHWTETPLWLHDELSEENPNRQAALMVARALFEKTESSLIKTEILYATSQTYDSREEYRDFIIHTIAAYGRSNVEFIKSALRIVTQLFVNDTSGLSVLYHFAQHDDADVRVMALAGIARSRLAGQGRVAKLLAALKYEELGRVRCLIVGAIARSRGGNYVSAVRDPTKSGEQYIDCAQVVTNDLLERIASRMLMSESLERQVDFQYSRNVEISFSVGDAAAKRRAVKIRGWLKDLVRDGVPFIFEDAPVTPDV